MANTTLPVIFLAFANDRDDAVRYLRNLPDEQRRLREVLEPAEEAGLCEVVVRSNCTASDIFKVFQVPKYRDRIAIFHYGGHANGYQLLLESAAGETAAADAGGLAAFLAQQKGLQLVFLNGCSTQQQTQGLLDANISAVISTSRSIDDQVATDFSHQFYQGLAGGATVRTAFKEAAASVQTAKGNNTRALYFAAQDGGEPSPEVDRWPWNLYLREGSETVEQWNLPEVVENPLFGLPPLPERDLPESPYRHLKWFTRKDAEIFFGRGHQIRELYDRITNPQAAPIVLFYGQSGVGKSSILDAGLMPRLEGDFEIFYLRRTEAGLLDALRTAFLKQAHDVPLATAWRVTEEKLNKPMIVFLDQVEELYTRPLPHLPNELDQLLNVIRATFVESDQRPAGKLVLGFRKEWLAELESQLARYELPRSKVFLEPLDRRGLIEAVQGPARAQRPREHYGLIVDDGLAEVIADDLMSDRDSATAPTLQILLTKMWTKAKQENAAHPRFSRDLYQQLKRDGILLRDFLNQQISEFRQRFPEVVDSGLLLDIVALHTTPLGTADYRTVEQLQEEYAHLDTTLPEVLQQCQDLHLLTVTASDQQASSSATRLAHDTLAPLVRERYEKSDKPGQRARRILDNRSKDWEGDRQGNPLDAADLDVVEQGIKGTRDLTKTEERLLAASRKLRDEIKRKEEYLRAVGAIAVAIIIVFAGIAWWQRMTAEKNYQVGLQAVIQSYVELDKDWLSMEPYNTEFRQSQLHRGERFLKSFLTDYGNRPSYRQEAAKVLFCLGEIVEGRDAESAIARYKEAVRQFEATDMEDKLEVQEVYGFTLTALGRVYDKQKMFKEALEAHEKAIVQREKLVHRYPSRPEYQLRLADTYMNVGLTLTEARVLHERTTSKSTPLKSNGLLAEVRFHKAQELRLNSKASIEENTNDSAKLLAELYFSLGNGYLNLAKYGDSRNAEENYKKAETAYLRARELETGSTRIRFQLAKAYRLHGNHEQSLDLLMLALGEVKPLVEIHAEDEYAYLLGKIYNDIGKRHFDNGRASSSDEEFGEEMEAAIRDYRLAILALEPLAGRAFQSSIHDLGHVYKNLALVVYESSSDLHLARKSAEQAKQQFEKLDRTDPEIRDALQAVSANMSEIEVALNESKAEEHGSGSETEATENSSISKQTK